MSGDRCIFSVKYVPAAAAGRLGGFLRYVQFRDQHSDMAKLDGLTRYVAHRDRSSPAGRLFGPRGNCGDLDRRALLAHISRSLRQGGGGQHPPAAYRMVLSPERAEGLDLKALTRAAVQEFGREGAATPPWIAAIHRNTRHPHVHIVMAARREITPGRFKTVVINRAGLARMKLAVSHELIRQRGRAPARVTFKDFTRELLGGRESRTSRRVKGVALVSGVVEVIDGALQALAAHQRRELHRWFEEEERRLREQQAQRQQQRGYVLER